MLQNCPCAPPSVVSFIIQPLPSIYSTEPQYALLPTSQPDLSFVTEFANHDFQRINVCMLGVDINISARILVKID